MNMRRKRYSFKMIIETTFLAFPETRMKEHDKLAVTISNAVEKELGIKIVSFRDCETGRFRKLC